MFRVFSEYDSVLGVSVGHNLFLFVGVSFQYLHEAE